MLSRKYYYSSQCVCESVGEGRGAFSVIYDYFLYFIFILILHLPLVVAEVRR
jgi:hypothetical protein